MGTVKLYQLIEFASKGRKKNGLKTIDIVPTTWIVEGSQGKLFARFMPPPYTGQNVEKLETMVKKLEEAPEDWPIFPVQCKSHADTYLDAVRRLKRLEKKPYVYTTETDVDPKQKSLDVVRAIKDQIGDKNNLTNLFDVPGLDDSSAKEKNDGSSSQSAESLQGKENRRAAGARSKTQHRKKNKRSSSSELLTSDDSYLASDDHLEEQTRTITSKSKEQRPKNRVKNTTFSSARIQSTSATDHLSETTHEHQPQTSTPAKSSTPAPSQLTKVRSDSCREKIEEEKRSIRQSAIRSADILSSDKKHLEDMMNTSPTDYKRLVMLLQHMIVRINKVSSRQEVLIQLIENRSSQNSTGQSIPSTSTFSETYEITLPLKTIEEFRDFDLKLRQKNCRDDFQKTFLPLLDCENVLSRSLTNIYKKYLTRDLALSLTMSKQMPGKHILKETEFAACIQDFFVSTSTADQSNKQKITLAKVRTAMGTVLGYAKDWNGKVRPQKPVLPDQEILAGRVIAENVQILYEEPILNTDNM